MKQNLIKYNNDLQKKYSKVNSNQFLDTKKISIFNFDKLIKNKLSIYYQKKINEDLFDLRYILRYFMMIFFFSSCISNSSKFNIIGRRNLRQILQSINYKLKGKNIFKRNPLNYQMIQNPTVFTTIHMEKLKYSDDKIVNCFHFKLKQFNTIDRRKASDQYEKFANFEPFQIGNDDKNDKMLNDGIEKYRIFSNQIYLEALYICMNFDTLPYSKLELLFKENEKSRSIRNYIKTYGKPYIRKICKTFSVHMEKAKKQNAPSIMAGNILKLILDMDPNALQNKNLSLGHFYGSDLSNSNLSNIKIKNCNFSYAMLKNVQWPNKLHKINFIKSNLTNTDFSHCEIFDCNFKESILTNVKFPKNIREVNFGGLDFTNYDFSKYDLPWCNFTNTNLIGVKWPNRLLGVDFTNANLANTDFSYCEIRFCDFTGADLTNVISPKSLRNSCGYMQSMS